MTVLRRSGPAYAVTGTLVGPEEGVAVSLLKQIMVEGDSNLDSEATLLTQSGLGDPVTTGENLNTSLFYVNLTTKILYFRIRIEINDDREITETEYCALGAAALQPGNNPATGAPSVDGAPDVGETLMAGMGSIMDADGVPAIDEFNWQWFRENTLIPGSTDQTYTIVDTDRGSRLRVRASFDDDAGYSESLLSDRTAVVPLITNSPAMGRPLIAGNADVGQTLTASPGDIADADGLINVMYEWQWLRGSSPISGATGTNYMVMNADRGRTISVRASFMDDEGNAESRTSLPTDTVPQTPVMYMAIKTTNDIGPADFVNGESVVSGSTISTIGVVDGLYFMGIARRSDFGEVTSIRAHFEERMNFDPAVGGANDEITINGGTYFRYATRLERDQDAINGVTYTVT